MATHTQKLALKKRPERKTLLPHNAKPIEVTIKHIGNRGDGVGTVKYEKNYNFLEYNVFVPGSLPGETIVAQPISISKNGIHASIIELIKVADSRKLPECNSFPVCGGCNFQHWDSKEIEVWKCNLIKTHLKRFKVRNPRILPLLKSTSNGRRRVSFQIKRLSDKAVVGFHERMGTRIVELDGCTIIDQRILMFKKELRALAMDKFPIGAIVEAKINLLSCNSDEGFGSLCLLLINRGKRPLWTKEFLSILCKWASKQRLARLSINDQKSSLTLFTSSKAQIFFGSISVSPPPGTFLQATEHAEKVLQKTVSEILINHTHIADLFSGCGTLSLPLIGKLVHLTAAESNKEALLALKSGVEAFGLGGCLTTKHRNLFSAPILPSELKKITGIVLDPPRSGALGQCQQIGISKVNTVAMVSCNPATFARDAACLIEDGFNLNWVQPIDQFDLSNHVELVGSFSR